MLAAGPVARGPVPVIGGRAVASQCRPAPRPCRRPGPSCAVPPTSPRHARVALAARRVERKVDPTPREFIGGLHEHARLVVDDGVAQADDVERDRRRAAHGTFHDRHAPAFVHGRVHEEPRLVEPRLPLCFTDEPGELDVGPRQLLEPRALGPFAHDDELAAGLGPHLLPHVEHELDPLVRDQPPEGEEERLLRPR